MLRRCRKCRSKFGCQPDDGKLFCVRCAREVEAEIPRVATRQDASAKKRETLSKPDARSAVAELPAGAATIPIAQLPEAIGEIVGKQPSMSTVKKWIRSGYRGVRLQVMGPAHFRFSTPDLVNDFLKRCGNANNEDVERAECIHEEMLATERAREILATKYGFKHRRGS